LSLPNITKEIRMTAKSRPLRYGLQAKYYTRTEIAAQKRAEARKERKRNDAQLELDEEP
jgi:hypothetical protein